jgi:hypothetical protein
MMAHTMTNSMHAHRDLNTHKQIGNEKNEKHEALLYLNYSNK